MRSSGNGVCRHRSGTFHYRHLLEGKPGTPSNFHLGIGQQDGDFASPRHRHNFDQFRFQIEGTMDFDRNGKMAAGTLGYFPEGAAYGPQTSEGRSVTAVLQFGGASGSGYLSPAEVTATTEELKKFGTFEGGVFRRNGDVEGRRNSDAYRAIWEHVHGRRMDYPKPRYRDPIMVEPENYDWLPVPGVEGVRQKPLGTFTERECAATLIEIAPGTLYRAGGPSVYLFLSGAGTVGREALSVPNGLALGYRRNSRVCRARDNVRVAACSAQSGQPRKAASYVGRGGGVKSVECRYRRFFPAGRASETGASRGRRFTAP